jgi:hypothetical protein
MALNRSAIAGVEKSCCFNQTRIHVLYDSHLIQLLNAKMQFIRQFILFNCCSYFLKIN